MGVQPTLGPDATALGQIFWYTLEGRDPETGKPAGGWDPQELRTIQDFYVRYSLSSASPHTDSKSKPVGAEAAEGGVRMEMQALVAEFSKRYSKSYNFV